MYKNVEQVLRDVYKSKVRMEPLNNTASVCAWRESKGAMGGGCTQAEINANAAMIISRIERVLNRYELAAVECKYSQDLKADRPGICAPSKKANNGVNLLLARRHFIQSVHGAKPKKTAIMDKYDINNKDIMATVSKVRVILACIEMVYLKLYDEFKQCGIIS